MSEAGQGRPDVPLNAVDTGFSAIGFRHQVSGEPIVCMRYSTPIGPLHFFYEAEGADGVVAKIQAAKAQALAAEMPTGESSNGKPGLIVPGQN